jgi:hypothetical protein
LDGSHIAGSGAGAIVGVALAALGTKIGWQLDDATSATIGAGAVGVGLAFGHALGKAWADPGIFPALRRGFFGASKHPK